MIYLDKGYIGCFEMEDEKSGGEQLAEYVNTLKSAGHKRIVAPINGDTWHTYRLVSYSSGEPFFPMEPQNPVWYNDVYVNAGFKPIKKYSSGKFPLGNIMPIESGVKIRRFNKAEPMKDLEQIYALSLKGFDENFLYNDISKDEFMKLYKPMVSAADEDLVLFAEKDGETAGFMFAFAVGEQLILKTIAVLPKFRGDRIGSALMNRVLIAGQQKNLETAIAALMSEENYSQTIVGKYGSEKFREYTLYGLEV